MCDKTLHHIDEARKEMFCQKGKNRETPANYCSTRNVLLIGLEYGAPVSRVNSTHLLQKVGEGWGWTLYSQGEPVMGSCVHGPLYLLVASKACSELVKCCCRSERGCGARCACKKANWKYILNLVVATMTRHYDNSSILYHFMIFCLVYFCLFCCCCFTVH